MANTSPYSTDAESMGDPKEHVCAMPDKLFTTFRFSPSLRPPHAFSSCLAQVCQRLSHYHY